MTIPPSFPIGGGTLEEWNTYKVHTDGGNVTLCVGIIGKPKQEAWFSNSRISNKKKFE